MLQPARIEHPAPVIRRKTEKSKRGNKMASPYNIHLETYDGPLDLLLDLIKKQEIDIHNIPIAKITGQYLDYLHKLEQLDMDISADFIYMAATLIFIKSKMLLPPDPLAGPEDQGDPRADLVHRLVEHEKFKSAAQLLHQRQQIEEHVWSKPDLTLYEGEESEGELIVSLVDLVKVFQQVLERRKEVVKIELHHEQFTIAQMMLLLRQQLVVSEEGIDLINFFESCPSRHAMIVSLLAVLELVRLQAIILVQQELFSKIWLRKHKMFDVVFAGGESIADSLAEPLRGIDEEYQ
jgi:segregation and condensation protein A